MSTARWSLRLPRAVTSLATRRTARSGIRRLEQRRWIQKPPLQPRLWAGRPENNEDSNEAFTKRMQEHNSSQQQPVQPQEPGRNTQLATALASSDTSDLVTEVHIPDDPQSVLPHGHPALSLLSNSSLVIQRQLELMNVMLGFEQANRYIIMSGAGETLGYIAERDHGIGSAVARQMFRTHRSFTTHIFDKGEREVLRIHRPFAWINSRIRIYDPVVVGGYEGMEGSEALRGTGASEVVQGRVAAGAHVSPLKLEEMRIIGEAQQQWAPLRRKYNLFSYRPLTPVSEDASTARVESGEKATSDTTALTEAKMPDQAIEAGMLQFAHVNEPFLSWDFNLRDEAGSTVGSVNRNFGGFAREIFTDTGVYALRMDSAAQSSVLESSEGKEVERYEREATAMTLDQRAIMLATAVSIDFDYFSRHSGAGHGGFMPFMWPFGGTAAEGGAAGAGAGAAGRAAEAGAVGAAGGAGALEGAAGTAGRGLSGAAGGVGESGIAAAGTMAGYEAMQRGVYGQGQAQPGAGEGDPANEPVFDPDNQSPQNAQGGSQEPAEQRESTWGDDEDPWEGGGPGDGPPPPSAESKGGGGGGGGDGGSWTDTLSDFFGDS